MENIILIGLGGHALSVADCIKRTGKYRIIGYTEVEDKTSDEYQYLGTDEMLEEYYAHGIRNVAIGVGYMGNSFLRDKIYKKVKKIGYLLPAIIDETAIISEDVLIEEGVFIGKRVVVNTRSCLKKMSIINTGSIIEHECTVGAYTHVAVGAVICGNVHIDEHAFVGANSTVIQGLKIGKKSIVGAGSVILRDVLSENVACGIWK